MTFQDWELATPDSEKTIADQKKPDLFKLPADLTSSLNLSCQNFYKDFLHLDSDYNSTTSIRQDLDSVSEKNSKFSWKTMCLTMENINGIIKFFNEHVSALN